MTSFGGYSRSKICGIVQSRRAKSPEQSIWLIPWFQELTKALKIPGKQEREIILSWGKKE